MSPLAKQMSPEVRHRILIEWNATEVAYPSGLRLHDRFEQQAERTPDAPAVAFEQRCLSYAELNRKANRLARHLASRGVKRGSLVGVYLDRSIELVETLYAISKVGAAYVPLDPGYPTERIRYMLKDASPAVLVTSSELASTLPRPAPSLVKMDEHHGRIRGHSSNPYDGGASETDPAYVIYTSGSTGNPKGVVNTHRGICNRLLWMQDTFSLGPHDVVLQKTPYSFDVSVWEFFWPLMCGARLEVAAPGGHLDSRYLVEAIDRAGVTVMHFVPSMLRIFLDESSLGGCQSLRRVICSGEALSHELQQRFFERMDATLHNLYGPTEAAVDVTYWDCRADSPYSFVPIGRPISNTQVYILDEAMEPVPVGSVGELHIGGVQVADGYLNLREQTRARFVPDPFSSKAGARLYKTGDFARYQPDGVLEYLGRTDSQVKVRGFRIELSEIESALDGQPGVRQSAVVVYEDADGDKQLVGYVVMDADEEGETQRLREALHRGLPEYMVPQHFVVLDSFSLTPSGKVDRTALAPPFPGRSASTRGYAAPRDALELFVAECWQQLLRIPRIGIHDRFFEIGGTSLHAGRFIQRVQTQLGEFVYVVTVFEAPTIAEYAALLRRDYPTAVNERFDLPVADTQPTSLTVESSGVGETISAEAITRMESCIVKLSRSQRSGAMHRLNPPMAFVLAPPRSGTTLLRVMLAGHPTLFAAPELQLLTFRTLQERRTAFRGKFSLWLEGALRAVMELKGCSADEAKSTVARYEEQNFSTRDFYRALQEWAANRMLVDKTPSYALDPAALRRAELEFDGARYVHLVRHPLATVRSFVKYRMNQVLYLRPHEFAVGQLGELVWYLSHRNILAFLDEVPRERWTRITFEDLVTTPRVAAARVCDALGIDFHPNLLTPYDDLDHKMVDGIHPESTPMGDTHFSDYGEIDSLAARKWLDDSAEEKLSPLTWELANVLGYNRPASVTDTRQIATSKARRRANAAWQRRSRLLQGRARNA